VYYGVLENPFPKPTTTAAGYLHYKRHLDPDRDTGLLWLGQHPPPCCPPARCPAYHGTSPYLLVSKYNKLPRHRAARKTGTTQVAVLDPRSSQKDPLRPTPG